MPKGATTRVCSKDDVHQCAGIDVRAKEKKDWLDLEKSSPEYLQIFQSVNTSMYFEWLWLQSAFVE